MTKCSNCRFRAKVDGKEVEGRIAVEGDYLSFLYSQGDEICYSILMSYYRKHGVGDFFQDFEIVPRAPETYQDWQVGDIACEEEHRNARYEVIFRSGELVFFKDWNNYATNPFTCSEAFRRFGFRLVLTDIEKQIIEERKKAEWKPQDGDVVYAKVRYNDNDAIFIYKKAVENRVYGYAGYNIGLDRMVDTHGFAYITPKIFGDLIEYRPATEEEKQQLFDAMAKAGKRWNAEKKVVEDIQEPEELRAVKSEIKSEIKSGGCQFRKFDPVLVRDSDGGKWRPGVFDSMRDNDNSVFKYTVMGCVPYAQCIPLNEKTEHLLGTTEDYKEEQS